MGRDFKCFRINNTTETQVQYRDYFLGKRCISVVYLNSISSLHFVLTWFFLKNMTILPVFLKKMIRTSLLYWTNLIKTRIRNISKCF